jgi:hypothetical protein
MSESLLRRKKFDEGAGEDPERYFTTLYIRYLQGLFNFMPIGHFHWEPQREHTEIVITAEVPMDAEVVEKFPALAVVLGPTQWAGLGIDNMQSYNMRTDKLVRTDLCSGFFVVYAVAGNDVVARRIAQAVANHTRIHQRILEGEGGFHQIARPAPSINSPSPPGALVNGDPKGLVMVQVNIPFSFQWAWTTGPPQRQAAQLRSIAMVLQEERAVDYPYSAPAKMEKIKLAISTHPVLVRRISGSFSVRPSTVESHGGIRPFQLVDLRPAGDEE